MTISDLPAAACIRQSNLIKGNADFPGFTDLIAHFAESHNGKRGANEVARRVVYEWMQQVLIEAALGARSLEAARCAKSESSIAP